MNKKILSLALAALLLATAVGASAATYTPGTYEATARLTYTSGTSESTAMTKTAEIPVIITVE